MGKSYATQLEELAQSFGLTLEQIPVKRYLNSFHEVSRTVRQRTDTNQYIYIEYQDSGCNADDYFSWRYIPDEEVKDYLKNHSIYMPNL